MIDGVDFTKKFKNKVLKKYVRALDRLDPEFARHILASQHEFFLAGKTFFEYEAAHAQKAMEKQERRMNRG